MKCLGIILAIGVSGFALYASELNSFCTGWRFLRDDAPEARSQDFDDRSWETVTLPHTPRLEALPAGKNSPQWQGVCWYRKTFYLPGAVAGQEIFVKFDGAMNAAEIWVNGQSAGKFLGGYLPYVADISQWVHAGETNVIAVRLDNRDNPVTGPKPLADLDFNLYGGLYRDAHLIIKNKLHITDANFAGQIAGGGVFVTFPAVSNTRALVRVQTDVKNDGPAARIFILKTALLDAGGKIVAEQASPAERLPAGTGNNFVQEIAVADPKLWSPPSPNLYEVRSQIVENRKIVDDEQTRVGIRRIEISAAGFFINGRKMFLRGCNRHQEYPYIGNALSDAAQFRDALKIKEAGFDFVRCSHYPPSPAFLDACDELGIVVMDSILGWQYFNRDPAFAGEKYSEIRQMIRRDRNHPGIALWEVSLNESDMPKPFIERANAIAHEEFPGDQCFTAGWKRGYDVFLQARQHGGCVGVTNIPCAVSEYGDWEYYAQNGGFAQEKWRNLEPVERSSRQERGDGEIRMLQQAENFQEAHNDDLKTAAFADGVWVMFDYSRGYAADLETSGVMDVFRLPKFSYWFYRSQRDANECVAGRKVGPVIFIANYWMTNSPLDVRVFSNCDEIALYLNGKCIGRRKPDNSRIATNLKHPPFTFHLAEFQAGELKAIGFIGGKKVAVATRRTPGEIAKIVLQIDTGGKAFARDGKDMVFCRAVLEDRNGTVVPNTPAQVQFFVTGPVRIIGDNPVAAEAGMATVLLQSDRPVSKYTVHAVCELPQQREPLVAYVPLDMP